MIPATAGMTRILKIAEPTNSPDIHVERARKCSEDDTRQLGETRSECDDD